MKSSNVEQFSQFIENVNNATSDVAVSINLDGTVAVDDIPINGKFSFEFQKMKSNMINDNSVALKVNKNSKNRRQENQLRRHLRHSKY
jgi:hypothetical protein